MHDVLDPIEVLRGEHAILEGVLAAFIAWADGIRTFGPNERAELDRFTRFFDPFLDRHHDAKEEDVFFRALQDSAPRTRALVHASLREREQQRRLLESLEELACRRHCGADERTVTQAVHAFVAAMRSHIASQECVLFPAARTGLTAAALTRAADAFAGFDARDERTRLVELARALVDAHGPSLRPVSRHVHWRRPPLADTRGLSSPTVAR